MKIYLVILNIIIFWLLTFTSILGANKIDVIKCESDDRQCWDNALDNIKTNLHAYSLEPIIKQILNLEKEDEWFDNIIGALYSLQTHKSYTKDNFKKAESYLLKSHRSGYTLATQNLAELYFIIDDYENTNKFLGLTEEKLQNKLNKQYVNWARLKAQMLYLHSPFYYYN